MTVMNKYVAIGTSNTWKQLGNHLFVVNGDLVSVYEGVNYDRFAMETVKDLNKTYTITSRDNWDTIADRFFSTPVAPNFNKAVA